MDPGHQPADRTAAGGHTRDMRQQQSSDVALVRTGWALVAVSTLLYATIPLSLSGAVMSRPGIVGAMGTQDVLQGLALFPFVLSGAWLVSRRPRNLIGWLLLASGFLQAVQLSTFAYGARALTDPDDSLPLALSAMWLASWTWIPSLAIVMTVLPGLYPTGRAASRFWEWQVRAATLGVILISVLAATAQGGVDDAVAGTRLPWDVPTWWLLVVGVPAGGLVIGSALVAAVGTLVRALRSRAPERQQLLWLFPFLPLLLISFFSPIEPVFALTYGFVPVAVVVGVLRYRLLGIEVVLRRTLLYAPLTLLVALVVGGTTTALARLIPAGPLPLLVGSAVVAVLVFPVADRLRGARGSLRARRPRRSARGRRPRRRRSRDRHRRPGALDAQRGGDRHRELLRTSGRRRWASAGCGGSGDRAAARRTPAARWS